ncbi:MAG: hypothetical protein GF384_03265 [Elusimicrobia bacterium]|nr:hypothetical protein [Elusimicrobiota bacterium]
MNAGNKLNVLTDIFHKLKNSGQDQETLLKHLSEAQLELENAGRKAIAKKIGDMFSAESKNHDIIKEIISDFEDELHTMRKESQPPPEQK